MGRYMDEDEPYVVIEQRSGGLGAFLAGLVVGAGVALLLAPQSGEETRRSLARGARRVQQNAQDLVDDVRDAVADTLQEARDTVEAKIGAARTAVDVRRRQMTAAMEAGRDAARQTREDLERRFAESRPAAPADVPPAAMRDEQENQQD